MRSFITCSFTKCYEGDQVMEDEMGRACSTWESVRGKIILECILGKYGGRCGLDSSGPG